MQDYLTRHQIIDPGAVYEYHRGTRDDPGINVMRCRLSGVIFLDRVAKSGEYPKHRKLEPKISSQTKDNQRRAATILARTTRHGNVLDVGAGSGGLKYLLEKQYPRFDCVDPNPVFAHLFRGLDGVPDGQYRYGLMMHVLEHLEDPIEQLALLRTKLQSSGKIFIEVPHANNALLKLFDCEAFKDFTFWSEHLILHTRDSLKRCLTKAGYVGVNIEGIQRYGLANTLYWLARGQPGGDETWDVFNDDYEYADALRILDMTDTLWAEAWVK